MNGFLKAPSFSTVIFFPQIFPWRCLLRDDKEEAKFSFQVLRFLHKGIPWCFWDDLNDVETMIWTWTHVFRPSILVVPIALKFYSWQTPFFAFVCFAAIQGLANGDGDDLSQNRAFYRVAWCQGRPHWSSTAGGPWECGRPEMETQRRTSMASLCQYLPKKRTILVYKFTCLISTWSPW